MATRTSTTTTRRTTSTTSKTTASTATTKTSELLVVTHNSVGAFSSITSPLTRNKINIECFTGYEWSGEAALRIITDNNRKASELLRNEGFTVQESPVVLWNTKSSAGTITNAMNALANANVNTYSTYATTNATTKNEVVVFNTNNPDTTINVLKGLK